MTPPNQKPKMSDVRPSTAQATPSPTSGPEQQVPAKEELRTPTQGDPLDDILADLIDRDPEDAKRYIESYRQVEGQ